MKRLLLILAALVPLLLLASCSKHVDSEYWDLIASRVPCYAGDPDSPKVDLTNPSTTYVYQNLNDGRYFTDKTTSSPIISRNSGWERNATESEKVFYKYSFNDGTKTWYLNF